MATICVHPTPQLPKLGVQVWAAGELGGPYETTYGGSYTIVFFRGNLIFNLYYVKYIHTIIWPYCNKAACCLIPH
jgi:hypothetical protein